jgi:anti-anti-sigma regulatory factor
MKPHLLTLSSMTTRQAHNQDETAEAVALSASIGERDVSRAQAQPAWPHLTLAGPPVWRHKLVLTGRLNHRTAVELEDEIECLCEEGVTILTLDLRRLEAIDSVGANTIALHGVACKRRGRDFAVVPGSPVIHGVLAEAGAESLLACDPGETGVLRLATRTSDGSPRDTSTVMIKNL